LQKVRRGREAKVEIKAMRHTGDITTVERPLSSSHTLDNKLDGPVTNPPGDVPPLRTP
jgi:hypothetical protein